MKKPRKTSTIGPADAPSHIKWVLVEKPYEHHVLGRKRQELRMPAWIEQALHWPEITPSGLSKYAS